MLRNMSGYKFHKNKEGRIVGVTWSRASKSGRKVDMYPQPQPSAKEKNNV